MIELLTSDPAIFFLSGIGLLGTAVSIVRDTRSQRERAAAPEPKVLVGLPDDAADRPEIAA